MVTGGGVERMAAGDGGFVVGVFNGCFYTDPTTNKPTFSNSYPGSISASDIMANIIDDPSATFEVQADDTFPVADLAGNFDIVDQSPVGDTTSGTSRLELDVTTGATTATAVVVFNNNNLSIHSLYFLYILSLKNKSEHAAGCSDSPRSGACEDGTDGLWVDVIKERPAQAA